MRHLLLFCVALVTASPIPKLFQRERYLLNYSIQIFREYLQIDTSKEENLETAVKFWMKQAKDLDLLFNVYRPAGKPICVLTWPGQDPCLPSIMLNSHMDVVPTEDEFWTHPPYSAHMNRDGDIFARGAQDDKDVAIQYIEAIRRLKENNITLKRNIHVTLMPDEETGGVDGMMKFLKTPEFKALNVGFALDEGVPSTDNTLYVTYQDRRPWQAKITVRGESGHASAILEDSAVEKMQNIITKINAYRDIQKEVMKTKAYSDFGAYDSVNVNILQGGFAANVIPGKMSLVVDTRFAVNRTVEEMQNLVDSWVAVGGNETNVEFIRRVEESSATNLDGNIYWNAMQQAVTEFSKEYTLVPIVCPAASDMIEVRNMGIPALGFSPKTYTTSHIHGNNEYLNAGTFLRGIDIYVSILQKIGNLPG